MKVLVTGASGFIGGCVVKAVARKGWTAIGTTHLKKENLAPVDIADERTFERLRLFGPFDAVVHCAGLAHRSRRVSSGEYERTNVLGTRNVVELARQVEARHFVHLSSVLVYGHHGNNITEVDECNPNDAYAESKLRSEAAVKEIGMRSGMRVTILRPAPVIGERCKGNFDRLIRAIDNGRFVMIGGSNKKSLVYVGDVADACVRAVESGDQAGVSIFNIAAPPATMDEIVDGIYTALGKGRPRFRIPAAPVKFAVHVVSSIVTSPAVRLSVKPLETWLSEDVYSTEAAREGIAFEARVSLEQAVHKTVDAYLKSDVG